MKRALLELVNAVLGRIGLELRRRSGDRHRQSLRGALEHLRGQGFRPATSIDVGVATGTFELYTTFPTSRHLLVEPLEEYRPHLDEIVRSYPGASYELAAASEQSGEIVIHVHPDLFGSSTYLERDDPDVNGIPRVVPTVSLDELCSERELPGPYLLKIDVQGAELDVLRGAKQVLERSEYVVLEAVLYHYFENGPRMADLLRFMEERGFALYDVIDPLYRPLDNALSQVDLAFVREDGPFRRQHIFASSAQRSAWNDRLARKVGHAPRRKVEDRS